MRYTHEPNGLTAITAADEAAILELNNAHEVELSRLDRARLQHLLAVAYHARMAPQGLAFLIAFAPDADYDGVHFSWFRDRFKDFVLMYAVEGGARSARPGHRPCLVCRPLSARGVRWSFHDLLRGQCRSSKSRV
jgi:predicted GNAT superfamily acetyltransferase